MSSKLSNSRNNSPRAMPVETIITRFKSAQQKQQVREPDLSIKTQKNQVKPKANRKGTPQKSQAADSPKIDRKKTRKAHKVSEKVEIPQGEYYPSKIKRRILLNKVRLQPKHELKIIAQTNKRKRSMPRKGISPQDGYQEVFSLPSSRDQSPLSKRGRFSPDLTVDEMIELIEDSGSLDDEDLLEILTCPSPVWWEDPPNGYIEDALFTRPRSTSEMYPSIRSQLQDNIDVRKRSNTPNVLSRREKVNSRVSNTPKVNIEKTEITSALGLDISLNKCDERFIKKRSKLESVLGNLKNKTVDIKNRVNKKNDEDSEKVAAIKNASDISIRNKVSLENETVIIETDPENSDDEHLTDMSFQDDDACLSDFENMHIPVQESDVSTTHKQVEENQVIDKKCNEIVFAYSTADRCKESDPKCSIDQTYCGRRSSIIEGYLEMEFREGDTDDPNRKLGDTTSDQVISSNANVLNIEDVVPKNLPPLKNCDKRVCHEGFIPENLPPLTRNPGVIKSETSPDSSSATSVDIPELLNSSQQDNVDSISDTNVYFLNDDDDDSGSEKKVEENNELDVDDKSSNSASAKNVQNSNDSDLENISKNVSEINFIRDVEIYEKLVQNRNEFKILEYQSLNTGANDKILSLVDRHELDSVISNQKESTISHDEAITDEDELNPSSKTTEETTEECITVYKIITDDQSKTEISNKDYQNQVTSMEVSGNLLETENGIESKSDITDSIDKTELNRDKMVFYYKKCKNAHCKSKSIDRNIDSNDSNNTIELAQGDNEISIVPIESEIDALESNEVSSNNAFLDSGMENTERQINETSESEVTNDTELGNPERKCIVVTNAKQISYCMKCSSIFDTEKCNYCYRINKERTKPQHNQSEIDGKK